MGILGAIGTYGGGGFLALILIVGLAGVKASKLDTIVIGLLIPTVIISIAMLIISKIVGKKIEEKFKVIRETSVQPQIDEAQKRHTKLSKELEKYIKENIHIIDFLPMIFVCPCLIQGRDILVWKVKGSACFVFLCLLRFRFFFSG